MAGSSYFTYTQKAENYVTINSKIAVDITISSKDFIDDDRYFYSYVIENGETPAGISERLYGDSKYDWVILLVNDITNIWTEWPMGNNELNNYIEEKYGSRALVDGYYIDNLGNVISDPDVDTSNLRKITLHEYENIVNNSKRNIRLLDPINLSSFVRRFDNSYNQQL